MNKYSVRKEEIADGEYLWTIVMNDMGATTEVCPSGKTKRELIDDLHEMLKATRK